MFNVLLEYISFFEVIKSQTLTFFVESVMSKLLANGKGQKAKKSRGRQNKKLTIVTTSKEHIGCFRSFLTASMWKS